MRHVLFALIFLAVSAAAPAARAASPAPTDATAWYYIERNEVQGPYLLPELRDKAEEGVIRPATQVHGPGRPWAFARDTPELRGYLVSAPAAPQPTAPPARPAPVAPPVQRGPDLVDAEFLLGGWRAVSRQSMAGRQIETTAEFRFRADEVYESVVTTAIVSGPGQQPAVARSTGRWSVTPLSGGLALLTLESAAGGAPEHITLSADGPDGMVGVDDRTRYQRVR